MQHNLKKLILSVKRGIYRSDDPRKDHANAEFKKAIPGVLARDKNICQYCAFFAQKYQEVHHLDDDHSNNSDGNLVTACCLCHACSHVGLAGVLERGVIIHLERFPGVSQAALNNIVRTLWVAEASDDKDIRMSSVNILSKLYKQNVAASKLLGTSDAVAFGDNLLGLSDDDYANRHDLFRDFYLLPLKSGFENQASYWASNVYNGFSSTEWIESTRSKLSRWAQIEFGGSTDVEIGKLLSERK